MLNEIELTDIDILMLTGLTEHDARYFVNNGAIIYRDFEECINTYLDEFASSWDDEDFIEYKNDILKMIETGKPIIDWDIVRSNNHKYYIQYCL